RCCKAAPDGATRTRESREMRSRATPDAEPRERPPMTLRQATEPVNATSAEEWASGLAAQFANAREAIGRVIFGQTRVVDEVLVTLLSGGHGLLIGVPGLAKTKLVATLGTVLGLDTKRIQFTPDLMPADIVGSEVLEEAQGGHRNFRFVPGPVF